MGAPLLPALLPALLLALTLPVSAAPPAPPAPPWRTGAQLLHQLRSPAEAAQAVSYLQGVVDATADRDWCYSRTRPSSAALQAAVTDAIETAPPALAAGSAGAIALAAWRHAWPCAGSGCCHA
jgi:hypothetical protein